MIFEHSPIERHKKQYTYKKGKHVVAELSQLIVNIRFDINEETKQSTL